MFFSESSQWSNHVESCVLAVYKAFGNRIKAARFSLSTPTLYHLHSHNKNQELKKGIPTSHENCSSVFQDQYIPSLHHQNPPASMTCLWKIQPSIHMMYEGRSRLLWYFSNLKVHKNISSSTFKRIEDHNHERSAPGVSNFSQNNNCTTNAFFQSLPRIQIPDLALKSVA